MRSRRLIWVLFGLLCLAGVCLLWQKENGRPSRPAEVPPPTAVASAQLRQATPRQARQPYLLSTNTAKASAVMANTNKFACRLSNTTKSLEQLMRDDKAILLENALIDTRSPLNFSIPANLRATGDPGAYIIQARGPIDNAFRAMLKASGATIVSYIPNNAYLVRAPAGVANGLAGNPLAQSVIPYEPYYKISSSMPVTVGQKTVSSAPMGTNRAAGPSLLALAVKQAPLPAGTCLTLGLFSDSSAATVAQIEKLGGQIVARDSSPFGPIVRVQPPADWVALAALPGVQIVEPYHPRIHANDLSRMTVGVSTDTLTNGDYLGLTGKNVMVEVNDSGIDKNHPDLTGRVIGDLANLVDTDGHGTHVAGIITGNGLESTTVTNAQGSINPGTNFQYRGKAPAATLFSMDMNASDQELQETAATNNALISNNSWNYGDSAYDLAAASYDAAVRDALPEVTGSQPVLFVFSAGNNSGSDDNGGFGGNPDTILSPATAKNVITVGALEQPRNITSVVTNLLGQATTPWQPMTDTGYQVASYSSRGNVGIGTEGTYGRFKPDVVAPGTFVVSTRSGQWDTNAYYNPTNVTMVDYTDQTVDTNAPNYYLINLPPNAVGVTIQVVPNALSPNPLSLPIYVSTTPDPNIYPNPATASTYFLETDLVTIPPDGGSGYLAAAVASGGFNYAVGDSGTQPVSYDLIVDIFTTNDLGNYYQVLERLNDSLGTNGPTGPYYRYETGTSMAAADVSGVLALMQDFFTNALNATPSPALLKAMLINGARPTGYYNFQVDNSINYEGWGLINLPSSLQPGITTNVNNTTGESMLILDQSPINALATGDSQTFNVAATNTLPLRITLAWTDPPGDPAAAIKLVNDLNLVVSNRDSGIVYYGNDIPASGSASGIFNSPRSASAPPNFDSINNVENVYLPAGVGTNFSVTVVGYRVNVNAVTAQTNNFAGAYAPNVVQDYALVISSGDGRITNAMTVTANPVVSNPTSDQQITYVSGNSGPLLNQFVGANTPLMGTNTLLFTNSIVVGGETNWQITVGMTNQWHFYVVTNTFASTNAAFTNAAFVTFTPDTLSIPRMGVFADSQANATRPQADIDLYVASGPNAWGLTNLDPNIISNCVVGTQVGESSVSGTFSGASLSRLGAEYVVDTNSQPNEVYYIGVKSEDQMASEYAFLPVFSATPFSPINPNGDEIVAGVPAPAFIPDGNPAVPGYTDVVALAIYPIQTRRVIVNDTFYAEDFSDLVGAVNHNGTSVILNNHDSPNSPGTYSFVYDDSGQGDIIDPLRPSPRSDGPGSLRSFIGQPGTGVWILHEADNAVGFTNNVNLFTVTIEPHLANNGINVITTIAGGTWFYDYIDVPLGATNLTITVTNQTGTATPPLELFVKLGVEPIQTDYDYETNLDSGTPPGNSISIGPPLQTGRYFFGVYNPSATPQMVSITATYYMGAVPGQVDYNSAGPVPILDDAVTTNSIVVSDYKIISSVDVGLCVEHPRISDLVFHLISPDGTRVLLMENRGGASTNGAGATVVNTNYSPPVVAGSYLVLTENTNLTTTPIKFAPPPFIGGTGLFTNNVISDFETNGSPSGTVGYFAPTNVDGWTVLSGSINVIGSAFHGNYGAETAGVIISNTLPTIAGNQYTLRFAYKVLGGPSLSLGVKIPGVISTNITRGSGGWQIFTITFPGSSGGTPLTITAAGGVFFLDYFTLSETPNDIFYLPEQPMDPLAGENAYGTWTLEIQDDRAGATNPTPTLVGWQLRFNFTTPVVKSISGGQPQTNSIAPGGIVYYSILVPPNASYATNILVSAIPGPVNVWFNQNGPPTGTNSGDYLLMGGVTTGSSVLNTISAPTNIVSGQTYYIGVQNANSFSVTNVFEVDFNAVNSLTNGKPQTNTVVLGDFTYYSVFVPTNVSYATNILIFATAPVIVWFNQNALPNGSAADFAMFYYMNAGWYVLDTNSTPPLIPGQTYYIGVQNPTLVNSNAVTFAFEVDFQFIPPPIPLTNGVPATNSIPSGSIAYYSVAVPMHADFATNRLLFASAPVNVWFNQNTPPSGANPPDSLLIASAFSGTSVLNTNTVPPLVPGQTYYIGVQNVSGVSVNFGLEVDFHLIPPPMLTNGVPATNSIPSGSIIYYSVAVPTNADFATNRLLFATALVNVWFNQTNLPSGANPPDYLLITNALNGTNVLSTNTVPPLVLGQTYYIGVQNTNSVAVTDAFEVDFHLIPTTNVYTTAGTNYWTCPAGVSTVTVECWGGGGMGSGCISNVLGIGHGGGGGGAYSESTVSVVPGQIYTIVVGAGGISNSVNGGDSTFNTNIVVAKGGAGLANNVTTGAQGGQASAGIGTTRYSGGNGGSFLCGEPYGAGGGSSAGTAAAGTAGGNSTLNCTNGAGTFTGVGGTAPSGGGNGGKSASSAPNSSGSPGSQPGGGGGGAMELCNPNPPMCAWPVTAGTGAAGKVRLTYTMIGVATVSSPSISGANIQSSGVQLQWYPSSSDAQYQVEWTTNLSPPIVWTINTNIITSADLTTNGTFTFTDSDSTNSPVRYYRLIQVQ